MRSLNQETLQKVENCIKEYQIKHGKSPSFREIQSITGMSSLNLVQRYIMALDRLGRIQRSSNGTIQLPYQLNPGSTVLTPLIGSIACGQPCLTYACIEESFALPKSLFGDGKLVMLRANGDSMIEVGINDGDFIIIRLQNYAEDGDIVVALIEEDTTLKRIYRKNGKVLLHPENSAMKDIIVQECEIQGVLISCIKMY